jgi:hypothetical protein
MRRPSRLAVAVVLALAASAARAQPRLLAGTQELSVRVSPDFEGAVGDMILADASYGRFLRDRLAAKVTLAYAILEDVAGEDSDYRMRELGLAADYHLPVGPRIVPYLGAGIGWRSSQFHDVTESDLVYGPRVGIGLFLADNVALELAVTYKLSPGNVFVNDFVAEDTDLGSGLGLRVHF